MANASIVPIAPRSALIPITTPVRTLIDMAGTARGRSLAHRDGVRLPAEARNARAACGSTRGASRFGTSGSGTSRDVARRARGRRPTRVRARSESLAVARDDRAAAPGSPTLDHDPGWALSARLRVARAGSSRSSAMAGSTIAGPRHSERTVSGCLNWCRSGGECSWSRGTWVHVEPRARRSMGRVGSCRLIHCRSSNLGGCPRGNESVHGDFADDAAVDALEDLVEAVAGDGEAVVALADDGATGVGRLAHELGDRLAPARRCRTGS